MAGEVVSPSTLVMRRLYRRTVTYRFYISRHIEHRHILSRSSPDLEQLWISTKSEGKTYIFGVIYRPPSSSIPNCINELEDSIGELLPTSDFLIMSGDINIDFLTPNRGLELCVGLLNSFSLYQVVNEPTHFTPRSKTLIDIICVSDINLVSGVDVLDVKGRGLSYH
ncbi:hypothetical protein JTB14_030955 [Gonioctena quinquepunctata]|nr:hypothetical protein JTB14_030955 [Gonioctena quinquepunctata]